MGNLSRTSFYRLRAWLVHFYTSLGLVTAILAILAVSHNHPQAAFFILGIAMFIDATDGTLARAWQVSAWTPHFDGRKLDDITDYINYTFIPVFFLHHFGMVAGLGSLVLVVVLISGAYGFCQKAAKTEDHYFTGFPNFWNILVFYLYLLHLPTTVNALILLVFSALIFLPIKLASYSTKGLRSIMILISAIYGPILAYLLATLENPDRRIVWLSLAFPLAYVLLSFYSTRKGNEGKLFSIHRAS